jgi:5'(3')-deoxyribonucleotidase
MKKILSIDMDGVVADFDGKIKELCPGLETSDEYPDYEARSLKVDSLVSENPNMFYDLKPIFESIEFVKDLMRYYDVYFLSTPMWDIPESFSGKRVWLEKHFGEAAKKRLILTHRKDLAIGDFLVDDRLKNGSENFKGKMIHFGSESYPNWRETYNFLYTIYLNSLTASKA